MNEERSIGSVIDAVRDALKGTGFEYEILVVDTSSKDRTREIAREKGAVVVDEPRKGYGRAYKTGFDRANGDVVVTLDADCTYPAEDIPRLLKVLVDENLDFISANRFGNMEEKAMSLKHRFGNWVLTTTTNILFRTKLKDSQSGMWVLRKETLKKLELRSDGMPFSEEIKIEAFRKLGAKEIGISYKRRVGEVKLSSWKDGRKNLGFLFKKRFGSG